MTVGQPSFRPSQASAPSAEDNPDLMDLDHPIQPTHDLFDYLNTSLTSNLSTFSDISVDTLPRHNSDITDAEALIGPTPDPTLHSFQLPPIPELHLQLLRPLALQFPSCHYAIEPYSSTLVIKLADYPEHIATGVRSGQIRIRILIGKSIPLGPRTILAPSKTTTRVFYIHFIVTSSDYRGDLSQKMELNRILDDGDTDRRFFVGEEFCLGGVGRKVGFDEDGRPEFRFERRERCARFRWVREGRVGLRRCECGGG